MAVSGSSTNGIGIAASGASVAFTASGGDAAGLLANNGTTTLWWGFDDRTSVTAGFGVPLAAGLQIGIPTNAGQSVFVSGANVPYSWALVRETS